MKRNILSKLILPVVVAAAFLVLAAPAEAAGPRLGPFLIMALFGAGYSGYRTNYGYRNYNYSYRPYSGYSYGPSVWYGTYPYSYGSSYYPYSGSGYGYSPYYLQP